MSALKARLARIDRGIGNNTLFADEIWLVATVRTLLSGIEHVSKVNDPETALSIILDRLEKSAGK